MYLGHIANLDQDRKILPPPLIKGLEYIKQTDFSRIKNGKYEIDGTKVKVYAMVQEYRTAPKDSRPPEAHLKYIDIQYVLEGIDVIGFGIPDAAN
jgi:biofilm protein TabA